MERFHQLVKVKSRSEDVRGNSENAYVDDFRVLDHGVRQGKDEDYLHLGGGDVTIHCNVVHRVQQPQVCFRILGICGNLSGMRLWFWSNSDRQGLTALLEDIQTSVRDVVVSYVSVIFALLTKRPDENGVVL